MNQPEGSVGVFDSGVGGISVLGELLRCLPNERFIYYGDSANAPYGSKTVDEVRELSLKIADYLIIQRGVKALVVACNTATSAAVKLLRREFSIPIIGMEPALKPAVAMARGGKVVVMATPMTIKEQKFQDLLFRYGKEAQVFSLPCPGLVELIEAGETEGERINSYLKGLFGSFQLGEVDVVVLGCTHYVFIKEAVAAFFQGRAAVIDGNRGTANQVKRVLEEKGLLSRGKNRPLAERVELVTSGTAEDLELWRRFLLKVS